MKSRLYVFTHAVINGRLIAKDIWDLCIQIRPVYSIRVVICWEFSFKKVGAFIRINSFVCLQVEKLL